MNSPELTEVLRLHKMWLEETEGGTRADLAYANLRDADLTRTDLTYANLRDVDLTCADLTYANLRHADLRGADLTHADLRHADLRDTNLRGANLMSANLSGADLRGADLRGANLDFSMFPLWCGGTCFTADDRLVAQVLAHLCSLKVSDKTRAELDKIRDFAKTSHRAMECGIL